MRVVLSTKTPEQTARLAGKIGASLGAGDCLLLGGPVGAGKTHFARHLIRSLLKTPEDVPSPTFTLVQTYETSAGELWHADLYRLNTTDEVEELGLASAFEQAICLVEWPELLGKIAPSNALNIWFQPDTNDETRREITIDATATRWKPVLKGLTCEI